MSINPALGGGLAALLESPGDLIDTLLAEQQQLTAVQRFSRVHESHAFPAQARYYRDLIPLTKPGRGEQYAFAVDLDVCTACKACVSACHSLNGLDEDEIWRNVGTLHGGTAAAPYQQTVTTACHHCVEPGCLEGCPVMAYEKDAETGIVRHLDDQCIGCQYCMLKCPYDVPKYSPRRGIVRKCDMCYHRLAADEAPACVQACPNQAISIRVVEVEQIVAAALPGSRLLPGAFDSSYTKPTTTYTTRKSIPANAHPADSHRLRLEHAHWPLLGMLVLSQAAAGLAIALGAAWLLDRDTYRVVAPALAIASFVILQAGLGVSVLHLGRPMKAWRFFLGLRTSWMSREILAFGVFAGASGAAMASSLLLIPAVRDAAPHWLPVPLPLDQLAMLAPILGAVSALTAMISVACSAMIYVDTHRPSWSRCLTFPKFFGTTVFLGLAGSSAIFAMLATANNAVTTAGSGLMAAAIYCAFLMTAWEMLVLRKDLRDPGAPAHRSAATAWTFLRGALLLRGSLVALATLTGFVAILSGGVLGAMLAVTTFLLLCGSAVVERYCFFTTSASPGMPGGLSN